MRAIDGAIRAKDPSETLQDLLPKLPMMGITRIANISGLDRLHLPVVACMRPNAKHVSVSLGKGISVTSAKVSAIMEAVEGHHFENPKEPEVTASYRELHHSQKAVIAPGQFESNGFLHEKLDEYPIGWVQAINEEMGQKYLIPHGLTCIASTKSRKESLIWNITSNGFAAGNTMDEAIIHGIFEVLERHALYGWSQFSAIKRDGHLLLDDSVSDDQASSVILKLKHAGHIVKIWYLPSLIGHAFQCAIYDMDMDSPYTVITGSGAHIDKRVALLRALLEAIQLRVALISGARDDIFNEYYAKQRLMKKALSQQDVPSPSGVLHFDELGQAQHFDTFTQLKNIVVQKLHHCGFQVLVCDHTKPEINIPVVQVFIPGMHFASRS